MNSNLSETESSKILLIDILQNNDGLDVRQLSSIYPDVVLLDDNNDIKVNYNKLLCNLIKYIQVLTKRIDKLELYKRSHS